MQSVQGDGFSFEAPASWTLTHGRNLVAADAGAVARLEVVHYTLEKAYRPALLAPVTRELDAVVERLAAQLRGRVVSRWTLRVAGGAAPAFRLDYPVGRTQQIVFVLRGLSEYELLCRRGVDQPTSPCSLLLSSFTLTGR